MRSQRCSTRGEPRAPGPDSGQAGLVVAVGERAVDGKANAAVVDAVAGAFGVPRRSVQIVTGSTSRSKLIEVFDPPPGLEASLEELLCS